ncbi:MAG: hypothetical protein QF415_17040 [Candidatus Undinarchaeales archaeon]|nr:hypothetical protein [Candidatus Undinarchaeales archaeon]MDP7494621.1 hypothetical protein [Candidatus Undinarchaeales archaeon]
MPSLAIENLILVFGKRRFSLLAFLIAAAFYAFNALIPHLTGFPSTYATLGILGVFRFYLTLIAGYGGTIGTLSHLALIATSTLVGMLFSMIAYKALLLGSGFGWSAGLIPSLGVFLGVIAPGCAACGIGLVPLLGLGAASISVLPFSGLELSILSIMILLFSIVYFSKNMTVCAINK